MEVQVDGEGDVVMRDASSLARDVFAIPELLEATLSTLPMKDLLFAQRVATNWRDTVQSSKALRRLLFLEPSKHSEIVAVIKNISRRDKDKVNRRALEDNVYFESAPASAKFSHFLSIDKLAKDQYYCRVTALNPLLCTAHVLHERCKTLPVDSMIKLQPKAEDGHTRKEILPALYEYNNVNTASCKDMFLTQPPSANLDFRLWRPARNSLPFDQYFPNAQCRDDRVTRTECCGVICCLDCVRRHRLIDAAGRRGPCPLCGDLFFRTADVMTSEPFAHTGEGVRLVDLLNAAAKEWVKKEDGRPAYGPEPDMREATVGLYFTKGQRKDKFCVGTLVLHPEEWVEAQSQAAG